MYCSMNTMLVDVIYAYAYELVLYIYAYYRMRMHTLVLSRTLQWRKTIGNWLPADSSESSCTMLRPAHRPSRHFTLFLPSFPPDQQLIMAPKKDQGASNPMFSQRSAMIFFHFASLLILYIRSIFGTSYLLINWLRYPYLRWYQASTLNRLWLISPPHSSFCSRFCHILIAGIPWTTWRGSQHRSP